MRGFFFLLPTLPTLLPNFSVSIVGIFCFANYDITLSNRCRAVIGISHANMRNRIVIERHRVFQRELTSPAITNQNGSTTVAMR